MKNKVEWSRKAMKELLSIDDRYQAQIKNKVAELVNFPNVTLDIKKLKGQGGANKYRLRVGAYRVLFEWINDEPRIIEIQAVKARNEQTYH